MFKTIKRFVKNIRIKYYEGQLDMCELGLEEATLEMNEEDREYWSILYDKYNKEYVKLINE